jgi:hypothetical protein
VRSVFAPATSEGRWQRDELFQANRLMVAPVWNAEADEGARLPWRPRGHVGTPFALKFDARFNTGWAEETWVLPAATFTRLGTADRQALTDWLDGADGIETVIDLAARPWNIVGASAIFGVFETGETQASWLVVQHASGWMLTHCADGFVSDVMVSLADTLALLDEQRRA